MDSSYVGFCSVVSILFSTQTSAQKSNTDSRTILPRYIELSIRKSSTLSKRIISIRVFSLIFMTPMKIVNYPWKIILSLLQRLGQAIMKHITIALSILMLIVPSYKQCMRGSIPRNMPYFSNTLISIHSIKPDQKNISSPYTDSHRAIDGIV